MLFAEAVNWWELRARDDEHTGTGVEVVFNQTTSRKTDEDKSNSLQQGCSRVVPEVFGAGAGPKQSVADLDRPNHTVSARIARIAVGLVI